MRESEVNASPFATKRGWEEILPPHRDAAVLHVNASELAAYEEARQILVQLAAEEREILARIRGRRKVGHPEGAPGLVSRARAQGSLETFGPREKDVLTSYLTPEEVNFLDELKNRESQEMRIKAQVLEAVNRKLQSLAAAACLSVPFGSYFYPVLSTGRQWKFHASDSNRCTKCNEDLRWGFGPLPFKSFHPDRLGCRFHCTSLGVPENVPKEAQGGLNRETFLRKNKSGDTRGSQPIASAS